MTSSLYYASPGVQLWHADASHIPFVSDKSVAMIATDPPYGINYRSNHHKSERFDPITADEHYPHELLQNFLLESHRVLADKGAIYLFTTWSVFHLLAAQISGVFNLGTPIVWVKQNWTAGFLKSDWANRTELILYGYKRGHEFRGGRPNNVLMFKRVESMGMLHPAEKPVSLLSYLITKSSDAGDTVLDGFAGTGSTLEAALETGRQAIGVEIEASWLQIAKKRLEKRFLPLFDLVPVASSNFQLEFKDV